MLFYLIITFDLLQHHSEILDVLLQLFVTAVCYCADPRMIVVKSVSIGGYLHDRS